MLILAYPDRASWLEARRMSIGSSDAAGIMGESSWASAVQLNYLKRGLIPPTPIAEEREQDLDWHRRRESEIADWWWHRLMPKSAMVLPEGVTMWDPGDFSVGYRTVDGIPLAATFDRLLLRTAPPTADDWTDGENGVREIEIPDADIYADVELKNAMGFMERYWQEEPPLTYLLQVQHQLIVADCRPGFLVASLGGQPPVWAALQRDGEMTSALLATYRRFWAAVVANEDVTADHQTVTSKAITARYPEDDGDTVKLDSEALGWWKARVREGQTQKAAKKVYDEMSNKLKQRIGSATYAALPEGIVLSCKTDARGTRRLRSITDETEEDASNGSFPF